MSSFPICTLITRAPPAAFLTQSISSNARYTLDHWDEKALPGFLASTVDTVRSVRKLHQVARQTEAMVVTGQDPDAWPKFKKAPASVRIPRFSFGTIRRSDWNTSISVR